MTSATNGAVQNIYETVGRVAVVLIAGWILWQIVGVASATYSQFSPACASIESDGRTAQGWMSRTPSGWIRVQQRDGSWTMFGRFDVMTLAKPEEVCNYPFDRAFQM